MALIISRTQEDLSYGSESLKISCQGLFCIFFLLKYGWLLVHNSPYNTFFCLGMVLTP